MHFDPGFELAIDGTDRQIVLQRLERLRDLDQVRIEPLRMASIVAHDNGARQIERDVVERIARDSQIGFFLIQGWDWIGGQHG